MLKEKKLKIKKSKWLKTTKIIFRKSFIYIYIYIAILIIMQNSILNIIFHVII